MDLSGGEAEPKMYLLWRFPFVLLCSCQCGLVIILNTNADFVCHSKHLPTKQMARHRQPKTQHAKMGGSVPAKKAVTVEHQPVLRIAPTLAVCLIVVGVLYLELLSPSQPSSSPGLTFGPPAGFVINRSAVPLWQWQPNLPFAERAAAFARPAVLRNAAPDLWRARRLWNPKYLASQIGKVSGVYENTNRWFGPYFDQRKPLTRLSQRVNPYKTNLTMSGARLIERIANASSASEFIYYSGSVDGLGQWAVEDIQPLDELISLNPAISSVNAWLGPPNVIAHCHYDGYHNFYVQLFGRKRFWLAPPSTWPLLRPAPFLHPCHAQCMVNLSESKGTAAPLSHTAQLLEVELEPGDLLYIPPLWFHHVQSLDVRCVGIVTGDGLVTLALST